MLSSNEWNKRDSRTFDEALAEFAVDFCLDTFRCSLTEIAEHLSERGGCFLTKEEIEDGYRINFLTAIHWSEDGKSLKTTANYVASFEDSPHRFWVLTDVQLAEHCRELIPEVEFRAWLRKNGYCLD